jgi:hypothetical protein
MDPNASLAILRQSIKEFRAIADRTGPERKSDVYDLVDLGETISEAADALDQWMSGGGFTPKAWHQRGWKTT